MVFVVVSGAFVVAAEVAASAAPAASRLLPRTAVLAAAAFSRQPSASVLSSPQPFCCRF